MAKRIFRSSKRPLRPIPKGNCYFCQEKKEPDYKDIADLEKFTTDRGRVIGRNDSGLCQKHQRHLTKAIKRARFLALLPFTVQV